MLGSLQQSKEIIKEPGLLGRSLRQLQSSLEAWLSTTLLPAHYLSLCLSLPIYLSFLICVFLGVFLHVCLCSVPA